MIDVDRLPLTQYLVLDDLAARYRLGETWWPFPTKAGVALRALQHAGLIERQSGPENTVQARLTEAGKSLVLHDGYGAKNRVEQMRRALQYIAEFAGQRADLIPAMDSVAEIARNGLAGEAS